MVTFRVSLPTCIRVCRGVGEGFRTRFGDGERALRLRAEEVREREEEVLEWDGDRERDRESLEREEPELELLRDEALELLREALRLTNKIND